jgi:hypothetical protein
MAMKHGHNILMIVQINKIKLFKTHADLNLCPSMFKVSFLRVNFRSAIQPCWINP